MTDIIKQLRARFAQHKSYRHTRLNEDWDMTSDEWVKFFKLHPEWNDKLLEPRGASFLYRLDEELPWSADNMAMNAGKSYPKKPARNALLGVQTLSAAYDAKAVEEAHANRRTISKKQWLEELREAQKT